MDGAIVQLTATQGVIIQRLVKHLDVRRLPPPHNVLVEMGCVLQRVETMGGIVDEPRVKVEANRDEMSKDDFIACPQSPDPSIFMPNML